MDKNLSFLKESILKILDDAKVRDVSVIDIKDKSNFAELLIICTGTSSTHIKSTSVKLIDFMKQNKNYSFRGVEDTNDWILIDLIDVVINIMLKDTRDFYSLESLWGPSNESKIIHK